MVHVFGCEVIYLFAVINVLDIDGAWNFASEHLFLFSFKPSGYSWFYFVWSHALLGEFVGFGWISVFL